jgi:hypothetical protein
MSKGRRSYLRGENRKLIDQVERTAFLDPQTDMDFDRVAEHPERLQELLASMTLDDLAARELCQGRFGPFARQQYLMRAPRSVRRNLERARRNPWPKCISQGVSSIDGTQPILGPWTAITANATETNLWVPPWQTAIAANSLYVSKVYHLVFSGIFTSTSTPGVLTWTFRYGQNTTPSSNTSLGASNAIAPPASLTNAGWGGEANFRCLSTGIAASGATARGWGWVIVPGAAAATSIVYFFPISAASAATIDQTAAGALIMSLTISVASQSYQCTEAWMESKN